MAVITVMPSFAIDVIGFKRAEDRPLLLSTHSWTSFFLLLSWSVDAKISLATFLESSVTALTCWINLSLQISSWSSWALARLLEACNWSSAAFVDPWLGPLEWLVGELYGHVTYFLLDGTDGSWNLGWMFCDSPSTHEIVLWTNSLYVNENN